MTVRLELKPEVEEWVVAQAKARGVSGEEFLASIIEDETRDATAASLPPVDAEGIKAMLHDLAEMGKNLPVLPDSALTRDAIYQDHD
jgi:hypothetical protein